MTKPKCKQCAAWQAATGCKTPSEAKVWIASIRDDIAEIKRQIDDMKGIPIEQTQE